MFVYYGKELYHHGILGQKWGKRRYQYEDGTLTPEGRERYGVNEKRAKTSIDKKVARDFNSLSDKDFFKKYATTRNVYAKRFNKYDGDVYKEGLKKAEKAKEIEDFAKSTKGKVLLAAIGAGIGLASTYGAYKISEMSSGHLQEMVNVGNRYYSKNLLDSMINGKSTEDALKTLINLGGNTYNLRLKKD